MRTFIVFLMSAVLSGQAHPVASEIIRNGQSLVEAGKIAEAQELYQESMREIPGDADLPRELGMIYFRQRHWQKAIENYNRSLSIRPGQVKALFYLAESYRAVEDLELAEETILQAATLAPHDAQVCQKYGEYLSTGLDTRKTGVSWLEKARSLNPKLEHIDFEIGKAEFELTDLQSATRNFELELQKYPGHGETYFFLAESWAKLGEWGKARAGYADAITHGYREGPAYYGLGKSLLQLEQPATALDPLLRSLALQPSLIQAHFQLARAYRELGRTQESRRENELFAAMTNRIDTSQELHDAVQRKAWKQVRPLLEGAQEREAVEYLAALPGPDSLANAYYLLGIMYYSMGRPEDSKRALLIAKSVAPQDAHLASYLGMVQMASGEAATAEKTFEASLAIDPSDALALIGLGTLKYRQQQWELAAHYLEKSRTADAGVLYMLCDAYFKLRKNDRAMLTAEVVRAFGSDRKDLLAAVDDLVKLHPADQPPIAP
jgi:tetratricopeptide (TPR) repeat protein